MIALEKKEGPMHRKPSTLIVLFLTTAAAGVAPTVEARTNLNGAYAFTTARTCTVSNNPFTTDPSGAPTIIPPGSQVFRQAAVDSGTVTFNPDGTGSSTSRSTTMNITATGGSILSISENSSTFTYTIDEDDTVHLSVGVVTFTTVLGAGFRNSGTVSPRSAVLQIGDGGKTLVSAPRELIEQETQQINIFNDGTITQYRLCTRSTTEARK
jgi:hypothetical protein